MSFSQITGQPVQYSTKANELASDYWLKAYLAGTTIPYSLATDNTGSIRLAKIQLNSAGYPATNPLDDSTVFIPHADQSYKLVLFRSEADADSNNTTNADWVVDNLQPDVSAIDVVDIQIRSTNLQSLDDYDRSPLFIDGEDFTAGVGPHVITVPAGWTANDPDIRFYKLDASGAISTPTIAAQDATTFTVSDNLLSTDTIFIGDNKFRNQNSGDPKDIRSRLDVYSKSETDTAITNAVGTTLENVGYAIRSADYYRNILSVSAQTTTPKSTFLKSDGSSIYVFGFIEDTIFQYDMTTPYDLTTASYGGKFKSVLAQTTSSGLMFFSPDGSKLYINDNTSQAIHQYSVVVPWDVNTATFYGTFTIPPAQTGQIFGLSMSSNGSELLISTQNPNSQIIGYTMGTAYDITTIGAGASSNVFVPTTTGEAIFLSNDDRQLFFARGDTIYTIALGLISALSDAIEFDAKSLKFSSPLGAVGTLSGRGFSFSSSGYYLSVVDIVLDAVHIMETKATRPLA